MLTPDRTLADLNRSKIEISLGSGLKKSADIARAQNELMG